ncbi:hypothetical protein ACHAPT_005859 [Fusarium lateritium]
MSTSNPPRPFGLLLVHGAFHPPSCFDLPKQRLEAAGFSPIVAVTHPSIGNHTEITADDDARNIQAELLPYLDQGVEFLALAHSYGGTPLTIAAKDHSVVERAAQGKKGGIRAILYITSNMPPKKGASALSVIPPGVDIIDIADGLVTANSKARAAFYSPDMTDEEADRWMATLLPQSQQALLGPASVGTEELTVPAYYILCEKDQTIPPAAQKEIVSSIPTLQRALLNPGGHCAFVTQLDTFVEQVIEIADEVENEGVGAKS